MGETLLNLEKFWFKFRLGPQPLSPYPKPDLTKYRSVFWEKGSFVSVLSGNEVIFLQVLCWCPLRPLSMNWFALFFFVPPAYQKANSILTHINLPWNSLFYSCAHLIGRQQKQSSLATTQITRKTMKICPSTFILQINEYGYSNFSLKIDAVSCCSSFSTNQTRVFFQFHKRKVSNLCWIVTGVTPCFFQGHWEQNVFLKPQLACLNLTSYHDIFIRT